MHRLAVVALAVVGCGGAVGDLGRRPDARTASAAQAPRPALGLVPGESMSFEVKLGGLTAGEAALAVGQPGTIAGHRAIEVSSRVATAGAAALIKKVSDVATTVIDVDTAAPLSMISDVSMGGVDYHADVAFAGATIDVTSTRSDQKGVTHDHLAFGASLAHDTHSAMAQLRGWDAAPGTSRTIFVMGGKRIWKSTVTFVGRETIGSAMGNRPAVRLDGHAWRAHNDLTVDDSKPPREFSVWLSDDADRVPLRVVAKTELGDVVIELTDYHRP